MRPTRSRWLAASKPIICALLLAAAANAETRPHYGGVLRIETQAEIAQLPIVGPTTQPPPKIDGPGQHALYRHIADLLFTDARQCAGLCKPDPGPFKVAEFVPGKRVTLIANDDFRDGRPYLDRIEITMGRAPREQMLDLQLGRADVIDVPAEATRRASQEGVRLVASPPVELVTLVFSANIDARVREAVSLTVDRAAIFNVLLGRQGEPTAALLPAWMTGYGFLFDASQNVTRARQLAVEAGRAKPITLAYDPQNSLARAIAERVALDARAAGLSIVPGISANADAKLVRITLPAGESRLALVALAESLGGSAASVATADAKDPQALYQAERRLRDDLRIVPLLHLPIVYGIAPRVKGWARDPMGMPWNDAWVEQEPKGQKP
jgi:ABC-type transport system substrate-binding protein